MFGTFTGSTFGFLAGILARNPLVGIGVGAATSEGGSNLYNYLSPPRAEDFWRDYEPPKGQGQ